MDLLLLLGGGHVESSFDLTVSPVTLIFNGPVGSYGVPGDMTVGAAKLSFYGSSIQYVFTAGDMAVGPARLFLSETTYGMVGSAGDLTVGAATLSFTGVGGTYIGSSFSLSVGPATLLFAVANGVMAAAQEYTLYAMNLKNGAVTRLPYAIDSMCELNGILYATGPAGIMIFEGSDTNNGADINARIAKGNMDFGTSLLKTVTDFYMRCRTQEAMKVSVWSLTASGSVTSTDDIDVLHGFKTNLPRGINGRELGIAVENVDGCNFEELAEMEFLLDVSSHRRGR